MKDYDPTLDEDLSALLDGELPPERASALRERIDEEPALAVRLAELERVDAALRGLPAEAPARLRVALRAKLDSLEELEGEPAAAGSRDSRPRRAWGFASGAVAAAAALALYWTLSGDGAPVLEPGAPPVSVVSLTELAEATDEEIGIAIEYETLADLDVIEDLDLLELMMELEEEEAERG